MYSDATRNSQSVHAIEGFIIADLYVLRTATIKRHNKAICIGRPCGSVCCNAAISIPTQVVDDVAGPLVQRPCTDQTVSQGVEPIRRRPR